MASPASTAFRAELESAVASLAPAIRGLEDKVNDTMSEELRAALRAELERLKGRHSLEVATLSAMDNLDAHGYPDLAEVALPQHLFNELQRESSDSAAADRRFESESPASTIVFEEPTIETKP